jgi:peptidoglycan/LPS O-acetylase OafA/YrhL
MNEKRIGVLDSFRFLAITIVILYHYYARWAVPLNNIDLYPYGAKFSNTFTKDGYLGVHFFFIISGFVIYFSILRCNTFIEFLKKRFIRLYPPLLLCAAITFVLVKLLDTQVLYPQFHTHLIDFLPSLTFTDAFLWNKLLHREDINYIDGAYWSLLVEVKFYILAGILYFSLKKKDLFVRYWSILLVIVTLLNEICLSLVSHHIMHASLFALVSTITFYNHIIFFSIGIYFYDYFINNKWRADYIIPVLLLLLYCHRHTHIWSELIFIATFIALFLCLIYNNIIAKLLDVSVLRRIGMASYTIYLLHQYLGIVLINKFGRNFSSPLLTYLFPILVYLFFIIISEFIYRYYELPSKRILSVLFVSS